MNTLKNFITPDMIKFQKQPNKITCYAATIAMIVDKPVSDVIIDLSSRGYEPPFSNESIIPYLVRNNIFVERIDGIMLQTLLKDRIYLGCTSTENHSGALHSILFYLNEDSNGIIFDPNRNIPYLKNAPLYFESIYAIYDCN
jgi:hypothetical protein